MHGLFHVLFILWWAHIWSLDVQQLQMWFISQGLGYKMQTMRFIGFCLEIICHVVLSVYLNCLWHLAVVALIIEVFMGTCVHI